MMIASVNQGSSPVAKSLSIVLPIFIPCGTPSRRCRPAAYNTAIDGAVQAVGTVLPQYCVSALLTGICFHLNVRSVGFFSRRERSAGHQRRQLRQETAAPQKTI